jgi:hypothetical protein
MLALISCKEKSIRTTTTAASSIDENWHYVCNPSIETKDKHQKILEVVILYNNDKISFLNEDVIFEDGEKITLTDEIQLVIYNKLLKSIHTVKKPKF